jgi:hypothetical protein
MGVITLTGGRGYQDIGTVGQTVQQLAGNVQSINQILDVGLRNSRDYQNGWIRVSDMIGLGICKLINTDQLQYIPAEGTSLTASDSLVVTAGNLTLVNDSADPGDNKFYGTNASGTLGWYSVSEGAFYTGIDSIDVSGTQISLVNDSADPGSDMYYGTNASGTLGWYSQPMDLAYIGIDSVHISGADVSLVNDSADPGSDMFYGTNASGTLGWYAQTTSGGTVTSIGSTTLTIAGTSSVPTVNLSGTQVTDIGLGGTALQPGSAVTSITSSNLTVGGTATVPTINLSGTQVTDIGLGATALQPGGVQNMESAGWNSSSGAVQTALTVPQDILIPFACTLREVDVLTQGTGSCTVTILRGAAVAGAITMPPTADITGGANVTCAALSKQIGAAYATTLAGWTTAFGQNDVLRLTLTANTGFTSVKVILRMY